MSEVKHVVRAIHNVLKALSVEGIAKDQRNDQQRFMFRGIDSVLNALSGHLAANDLIIIPRVTDRAVDERETKSGGALFSVTCKIEYDFISAKDGSTVTAVLYGEAMDSGDKATNKAMSAAYKYMAIQSFAIPTEAIQDNDSDASSPPEVKGRVQEKRDSASRPEQERVPSRDAGQRAIAEAASQSARAAQERPSPDTAARINAGGLGHGPTSHEAAQSARPKHPILMQLEAALSKYGASRPQAEEWLCKEFNVSAITAIPHAILPQALIKVLDNQKRAKEVQKAAKQPAKAKPRKDVAPPDDGDVPEQEHDQDDQGHDESSIPV